MKKKVLFFIGTRPEAIKVSPVIKEFKRDGTFEVILGLSGQHSDLIYKALDDFDLKPDFDLEIYKEVKSIEDPVSLILKKLKTKISSIKPDLIFVHGDTSTTFAGALSAFYEKIPVAHIEAGLRSHNLDHPWPEEGNRKLVGSISNLHFAPTFSAVKKLLNEGVLANKIILTGNTVVDAIEFAQEKIESDFFLKQRILSLESQFSDTKKRVLLTGHRRENFGQGIRNVFEAAAQISELDNVEVVFPIHPNPTIRESIESALGSDHKIKIVNPFDYFEMQWMLSKADLLITDSGGLQEEAPSFGVPVLITREATERMEIVDSGMGKLVGTDKTKIFKLAKAYIEGDIKNTVSYNPFGDGFASGRILKFTKFYFNTPYMHLKPGEMGFYNLLKDSKESELLLGEL